MFIAGWVLNKECDRMGLIFGYVGIIKVVAPEGKAENAETSVGMPDTSPIEGGADSSMAVESVSVEG